MLNIRQEYSERFSQQRERITPIFESYDNVLIAYDPSLTLRPLSSIMDDFTEGITNFPQQRENLLKIARIAPSSIKRRQFAEFFVDAKNTTPDFNYIRLLLLLEYLALGRLESLGLILRTITADYCSILYDGEEFLGKSAYDEREDDVVKELSTMKLRSLICFSHHSINNSDSIVAIATISSLESCYTLDAVAIHNKWPWIRVEAERRLQYGGISEQVGEIVLDQGATVSRSQPEDDQPVQQSVDVYYGTPLYIQSTPDTGNGKFTWSVGALGLARSTAMDPRPFCVVTDTNSKPVPIGNAYDANIYGRLGFSEISHLDIQLCQRQPI
eukprot:TRINITY_DN5117_c0_g1_i2.p1 TRINITY_DN5117_c0_g1~~TRINITY_DN5117_c0_g1_i2.p1  ORF type:complete len:328 (-),score=40.63 TRINITY_DN5117_c0_g1_i2:37-1020(-)